MKNFLKFKMLYKNSVDRSSYFKNHHRKKLAPTNDCIVIMQQPKLKLQCVNASILQKRI